MTTIVGRNCKIEVALTFDSPMAPTAVTNASTAVATLTAHAGETGDVGYWTVAAGMVELDGQAVHITETDANTMTLNGLDSSLYSTYSAGSLVVGATVLMLIAIAHQSLRMRLRSSRTSDQGGND